MPKKTRKSRKHKKIYRMKGCSRKNRKSLRKYHGGTDLNLAYSNKPVHAQSNPFLAYTGKGGTSSLPQNINSDNKTIPSTGPPANGYNFINSQTTKGGGCGCGLMKGGTCGTCGTNLMNGGSGNNGIPYANGLVGSPWTASPSSWPGVKGISGDSNYLAKNDYKVDPQTSMKSTGANFPFSVGGKKKSKISKKSKKHGQKAGGLSNFMGQDLINLGRQFQYGLGSTYNAIAGYSAPVNPMPWKGQLTNASDLNAIRKTAI